jgi:hypothetical protein
VRKETLPPSVSRQCGILNISQPYRLPKSVMGDCFTFLSWREHVPTEWEWECSVGEVYSYVNHNYSLEVIQFDLGRKLSRKRISIIGHLSVFLHTGLPLCPAVPLLRTRFMRCHFTLGRSTAFPPSLFAVLTLALLSPAFNFVDIGKPFRPCFQPGATYCHSRIILTSACLWICWTNKAL